MKRFIIATICFSNVIVANAASTKNAASTDFCKAVSETAQTIMEGRQYGMSILEQLQNNDDVYQKTKDKSSHDLINLIIMAAYKQPQYSTNEYQKREINNFAANYYLDCMS